MTQQKEKSKKKNVGTKDFSASSFKLQASRTSGFTFVELIIVISIFAALSSVVMFNFTDFSSNVKLQNLVQDVALQIRQAQLSGSSGRMPPQVTQGSNTFTPTDFANGLKPAYGVHFDITENTQFVYFADFDMATIGEYDNSTSYCDVVHYSDNECIDVLSLPDEFIISGIEVIDANGPHLASISTFQSLDIIFTRPKLEASFAVNDPNIGTLISAKITLRSSRGQERTVSVSRIGQISAQ